MKCLMFASAALTLLSTSGFAQSYICDHQGFSPMEITVAISGNTAQFKVVRGTGQDSLLNPEGEIANLALTRLDDGWATFSGISTRASSKIRYLEFRAQVSDLRASSGAFRASLVLGQADGSLSDSAVWPHDMVCRR